MECCAGHEGRHAFLGEYGAGPETACQPHRAAGSASGAWPEGRDLAEAPPPAPDLLVSPTLCPRPCGSRSAGERNVSPG